MTKVTLRNISRAAALAVIFLSGAFTFLSIRNRFEPIPLPPGWAKDITLRENKVTGTFQVHDEASNKFLFEYSADQKLQPVLVEKKDDKTWSVTFKRVRQ